ncbi:neuronal acetylcholine receptor subunit alpha-3-like [Mercenaria mercenaria]|uniref:neuronal acetylcholine receptor subunit alpha-3-like n=1 Tax=Mercenaria mercenaria TaxID=6596 RepID=UPI00234EDF0F|nr:neuronal acetylcholine receptor subunit alpha-3-like [Mercenaria mercenaria]
MCGIYRESVRTLCLLIGISAVVRSQISITPGVTLPNFGSPPTYSNELETDLRDWLFKSYHVRQRPKEFSIVRIALNLLSLNYLTWFDTRLVWINNSTYDNINFLFSDEKSVWKPPIIVENSVDDIDVISRPNVPMRISANGKILWVPAGIFTTHCESHVTYWPLDTQTCDVILSSWSYTVNEVALDFELLHSKILTSFYQENGEWELISKEHTSRETRRESESFSRLIFTLTFRRRPLFHMLNTLFPVVLMGFLTVAVFKLSPESGERVGLALTILLAYAVYLSVMAESIPQTSLSASLLSSYIASILFLQTLAVLLTVFYLDTYFTPEDKPVPKWLQSVTSSFLSKLACVDCHTTTMKVSPDMTEVSGDKRDVSIEDYKEDKKEVWVNEVDEENSWNIA